MNHRKRLFIWCHPRTAYLLTLHLSFVFTETGRYVDRPVINTVGPNDKVFADTM